MVGVAQLVEPRIVVPGGRGFDPQPSHENTMDKISDPDDRTGFCILATIWMELTPWLDRHAGELRAAGFEVADRVPDCAVLDCRETGFYWRWVSARFTVQSDMLERCLGSLQAILPLYSYEVGGCL